MGRTTSPGGRWLSQRTIGFAAVGLLLAGALIGNVLANRPAVGGPGDVASSGDGRALYVTYCASCHGISLEGQPNWKEPLASGTMPAPPHDASGHTWHHADDLLFQITKAGGQSVASPGYVSGMPAFGAQLSDAQIGAVLAYIKSTWPPEIQAAQQQVTQQSH
jgi:mono/diheme cytochrome c family protein